MLFTSASFRTLALCSTMLCVLAVSNAHAATTATAPAASPVTPGIASKHDNSLPIEISSDTLEVRQNENVAIFHGNVIAVQGDFRLKSDVMHVHYKQKQDSTTPAPATPAPSPKPAVNAAPGDNMGAITLIEVEGNVLMATPEESARGDRGDYHADSRILHLFGQNVVLTKGKNILRGNALEYNMNTGRSVLTHAGENTPDSGRVRGVFVPQNAKPADSKDGKAKAPATTPQAVSPTSPPPAAATSQQTVTAPAAVPPGR